MLLTFSVLSIDSAQLISTNVTPSASQKKNATQMQITFRWWADRGPTLYTGCRLFPSNVADIRPFAIKDLVPSVMCYIRAPPPLPTHAIGKSRELHHVDEEYIFLTHLSQD